MKKIKMVSEAPSPRYIIGVGEVAIGEEFEVNEEYAKKLEKSGQFKPVKNKDPKPKPEQKDPKKGKGIK